MATCKGCEVNYSPEEIDPRFWNIRDIFCNTCHSNNFKNSEGMFESMLHKKCLKVAALWSVGVAFIAAMFGASGVSLLFVYGVSVFVIYRFSIYKSYEVMRKYPINKSPQEWRDTLNKIRKR